MIERPSSRILLTSRALLASAGVALSVFTPAAAIVTIDGNRGNFHPLPIAIPNFIAGPADADMARNITQVITADLQRSGLFIPIDQAAYIEKITNFDALPRF